MLTTCFACDLMCSGLLQGHGTAGGSAVVRAGGLLGGGCSPQLGPRLPCTSGAAAGPLLPFAEMASLHLDGSVVMLPSLYKLSCGIPSSSLASLAGL